ncbi:hypothetical protein [Streptomyces sp. NPDC004579]|uniref:hypothetical protein n=1 Tax=Streptomyces sp. NPDC004579 TaxID=3154667 RepID=UPI0033AD09BE
MPTAPPVVKPASRRTTWIIVGGIAAVLAVVTAVTWGNGDSYRETVAACRQALEAQTKAGGSGRPDVCEGVKKDDYDALVVGAVLKYGLGQQDKDTVDLYDDGSINGSLG